MDKTRMDGGEEAEREKLRQRVLEKRRKNKFALLSLEELFVLKDEDFRRDDEADS